LVGCETCWFEAPIRKNVPAVALGRLGALKGGKARAQKLTAEERSAGVQKAAISG
jgi:hypothetical protein